MMKEQIQKEKLHLLVDCVKYKTKMLTTVNTGQRNFGLLVVENYGQ